MTVALTGTEYAIVQAVKLSSEPVMLLRHEAGSYIVVHVNDRLSELAPRLLDSIGRPFDAAIQFMALSTQAESLHQCIQKMRRSGSQQVLRVPYGTQAFYLRVAPIFDEATKISDVLLTIPIVNFSEDEHNEVIVNEQLRSNETAYQRLVEACPVPIVVHRDLRIQYANPSAVALLLADSVADLLDKCILDYLPDKVGRTLEQRSEHILFGQTFPPIDTEIYRRDNSARAVQIVSMPIIQDGMPAMLSLFQDVSEHKKMISTLERLAYYDGLTELPNRHLTAMKSVRALRDAAARGEELSILFIDFDGFKEVNDTYGHDVGDSVLQSIAKRLRSYVDASRDVLGRIAGDEFTITRKGTNQKDTESLAAQLLVAFREPLPTGIDHLRLGLSIGISRFPLDSDSYDTLLRYADSAMYRAKHVGGNTFSWFRG